MKLDLTFEEVFPRSIDAVWRAITDPDQLARWLMDNDFAPRVGHKFTLRDPAVGGWRGWIDCEVLELDAPHRMVWSWHGGVTDEVETRVVFELRAEGTGTRLVFRHHGDATAERVEMMRKGWTRKLALLPPVLGPEYGRRIAFAAPRARVYDAIATLDGLRGWWTALVTRVDDTLRFEFAGLAEHILMHVDDATPPARVQWTCVEHSALPEWAGTQPTFELAEHGAGGCELVFRHVGLTAQLTCYVDCRRGWDHFLASLVGYVERGVGTPFTGPR